MRTTGLEKPQPRTAWELSCVGRIGIPSQGASFTPEAHGPNGNVQRIAAFPHVHRLAEFWPHQPDQSQLDGSLLLTHQLAGALCQGQGWAFCFTSPFQAATSLPKPGSCLPSACCLSQRSQRTQREELSTNLSSKLKGGKEPQSQRPADCGSEWCLCVSRTERLVKIWPEGQLPLPACRAVSTRRLFLRAHQSPFSWMKKCECDLLTLHNTWHYCMWGRESIGHVLA